MKKKTASQTYIINEEPVLSNHAHRISCGKGITYFAHPDLSGIKLSPFTFDQSSTLTAAFYSTAWEVGLSFGVKN